MRNKVAKCSKKTAHKMEIQEIIILRFDCVRALIHWHIRSFTINTISTEIVKLKYIRVCHYLTRYFGTNQLIRLLYRSLHLASWVCSLFLPVKFLQQSGTEQVWRLGRSLRIFLLDSE